VQQKIIIYTDGGSRGNPGPAAAGFVLTDQSKQQLLAKAVFIGNATNNVAEYTGLIEALKSAKQLNSQTVEAFSDSELMVKQINGQYRVKNAGLKPLYEKCINLLAGFTSWQLSYIGRDKNKKADAMVNKALDVQADVEEKPKSPKTKSTRLGVLISGGGTTMINIFEQINAGKLNAEIAVVISSRSAVGGVEKAKKAGLNVKVIRKKDFADIGSFSNEIEDELTNANVDLVIQAGWLCHWKVPEKYTDRVMNIHPALLPSFGGQGMWGHHVHEVVLENGCKISGCTVHFCTNEYDKGPIIVQRSCPAKDTDDPDTLAARVFEQECIAYPEAISLFNEGKIVVQNGRVKIKT